MSLAADAEYHVPPPEGVDRTALQADAPGLLPLLDTCPDIHVYTSTHAQFEALSQVGLAPREMAALAIVRPTTEAEISATVRLCSDVQIPLTIRSGGNDVGERSRSDGGVVVDVRSLDAMTLSADRKSVRIGGGVVMGKLLEFLDAEALDTPCGWGDKVGYVAWACGGGYGVECGSRGLGVDQILAGRIVAADGEVLEVAEGRGDQDAWWALRGGGPGVVGVVSELTIKVYPRSRVLAGYIWFPLAEAESVFGNMQKLYEQEFPDNFAGEVFVINPLGDGGFINYFFYWLLKDDASDLEEVKAYHEKIRSCGTVINDTVQASNYAETTPYKFLYTIKNPDRSGRSTGIVKSCVVPSFSREFGAIVARHPLVCPLSAIVLHGCHGAGTRLNPTSSFGNRDAHLLIGISARCEWGDEQTREKAELWANTVYDEIAAAGLLTGWKYVNFNPPEKGDGKMYLGSGGVLRMRKVKERLDPKGLFANSTPDLDD